MIEIIRSQSPVTANAIKGKYLVTSLPLTAYRSMFPGTPIFVENADDNRSRMQAWPVRLESSDAGVFQGLKVVRGDDNLLSKRMEPFNGFVCESETDVLALLNSRVKVEKIISQAGHVDNAVIGRELEALYADVVEASKVVPESELDEARSWAIR